MLDPKQSTRAIRHLYLDRRPDRSFERMVARHGSCVLYLWSLDPTQTCEQVEVILKANALPNVLTGVPTPNLLANNRYL